MDRIGTLFTGCPGQQKMIDFQPWYGELGWEVMTWVPSCRKQALDYDRVKASSFRGMAALYADFVTEFRPHNGTDRSLDYPKFYRPDGIYHKYGHSRSATSELPEDVNICQDILIHARGISRKNSINYRQWPEFVKQFTAIPEILGFIGSESDQHVPGCIDFRNIDLKKLMNRIAKAKLVIGCSSGIMHLVSACGTNLVVWGDDRTYFGETLEQRYKVTWNPFDVKVGWITANDWQPKPIDIIKKIEQML